MSKSTHERCKIQRRADMREMTRLRRQAGIPLREILPNPNDVAARLAEIPPDTRSLTARVFGDPLPGRSAFDRYSRAETP
jgi:hypothetical protein